MANMTDQQSTTTLESPHDLRQPLLGSPSLLGQHQGNATTGLDRAPDSQDGSKGDAIVMLSSPPRSHHRTTRSTRTREGGPEPQKVKGTGDQNSLEEDEEGTEGSSIASAVFNLTTTSVGAGIMALPATLKVLGIPLGVLAILFLGWLTDFSLRVIVRSSIVGSCRSYGELVGVSWGHTAKILTQVFVMLQAFGSLVVYLIITGDVLSGSMSRGVHHTGLLEELAGGPTWWNARLPVLVAILLFLLLPLCCLSRIDSLMTSSAVSVALAVLFVLFTITACLIKFIQGTLASPRLLPEFSMEVLTAIPVMSNAFICHYNVQPIYGELQEKTEKAMFKVAYFSQLIVTSIYIGASVSSYLLFGDNTASDVLANFDADLGVPKFVSDLVRLGYVAHLLLVFPIVHFPLRLTLDVLLFPHAPMPLSQDKYRFTILTATLLGLLFFCATVVPDIYVLFSFLGALVSVSIGFTLPALVAIGDKECAWTKGERALSWFMLVLGAYLTFTGLLADTALL